VNQNEDPRTDFYHFDEVVPSELGLTSLLVDRYASHSPLEGITALFFQHQLANQVPMVKALIALGLDPARIHWVDIPYTSHASIRAKLGALGIPEENFRVCDDFESLTPYALYQRQRAVKVVDELLKEDPDKLVVLDDGAYFAAAASCFDRSFTECSVVEQTSRGFKKVAKNAAMAATLARLPLIDVAQSAPKSLLESPFIGAAVCASITHHIEDKLNRLGDNARFLVLGFGNIGEAVAKALSTTGPFGPRNVYVSDPHRETEVRASSFEWWERSEGGTFDLVVGCSGTTSFDVGDYVFLNDDAVLVSASSGAVEFNRRNVVEWAGVSSADDLAIGEHDPHDLHSAIPIHFPNRDVTLLNGGFPANFDGRVTCLPYRYIQITMALMVLGTVQAALTTEARCHNLDTEVMKDLTEAYYQELDGDAFAASVLPAKSDVMEAIDHDT
jgi:S-adenosylhomocysteine hydrolase